MAGGRGMQKMIGGKIFHHHLGRLLTPSNSHVNGSVSRLQSISTLYIKLRFIWGIVGSISDSAACQIVSSRCS